MCTNNIVNNIIIIYVKETINLWGVFLRNKYIAIFVVLFLLMFITECSSTDRKNLYSEGTIALSQNMEVVKNYSELKCSGKNRYSTLIKPSDFKLVKPEILNFNNDYIRVILYAKNFAQGNAVYVEIEKQGGSLVSDLAFFYKDKNVPLTGTSWGFRGLWGIDPEEKPGNAPVLIRYRINGKDQNLSSEIMIKDVKYPVSKSMLDVGKFSNKDYTSSPKFRNFIAECSTLRKKAFNSVSEDSMQSVLAYPRDMYKITGDFWRKRIYLNYNRKNKKRVAIEGKKNFHKGVDLKGGIGAPVFAIADGIIVLSHSMFYEGNMIIIDHGNKVFSYYQHLNSIKVKEGEKVRAGEVIGGVGATGIATGPHLHVSLYIRGVYVDPLSLLSLPVSR